MHSAQPRCSLTSRDTSGLSIYVKPYIIPVMPLFAGYG